MIDESAFKNYNRFEEDLKHKNRFFVDPKFVESIKEVIKLNTRVKGEGTILYRAKIHTDEDEKNIPLPSKKMYNPRPLDAVRGRANPDGISYLYLSSCINICIKEVSPKYRDIITVDEFSLKRDIELIDLVSMFPSSKNNYNNSLNHCIRMAFSKTQLSARPEIEYLPYQFICELIKNENYAGVLYYSTYDQNISSNNYNIVLFDRSLADLDSSKRKLIQITSANYKYKNVE